MASKFFALFVVLIVHQIIAIESKDVIDCTINYPITDFVDGNFSFHGDHMTFKIQVNEEMNYFKKGNGLEIKSNSVSILLNGHMLINKTYENGTLIIENIDIDYEEFYKLHGFAEIIDGINLRPSRYLLIPTGNWTPDWYILPHNFKQFIVREAEICLYLDSRTDYADVMQILRAPDDTCPIPEIPYKKSEVTEFQVIIDKFTDIVLSQVVEKFLRPTKGIVVAPRMAIPYTRFFIATGLFDITDGTLGDLMGVRRRSSSTFTRIDDFASAVLELDLQAATARYKNYEITGAIKYKGENLTIDFPQGIIVKAMVHLNIDNFPCDIRIQDLQIESKGDTTLVINDVGFLIRSQMQAVFENDQTRIFKLFANEFRKYINREMQKVDCKNISFLDYLESSLRENITRSTIDDVISDLTKAAEQMSPENQN